jgi:hypothetical protein
MHRSLKQGSLLWKFLVFVMWLSVRLNFLFGVRLLPKLRPRKTFSKGFCILTFDDIKVLFKLGFVLSWSIYSSSLFSFFLFQIPGG